jgi:arginyl-tRNA synthetase
LYDNFSQYFRLLTNDHSVEETTLHQALIETISAATGLAQEEVKKALGRPKDLSHGDFAFPCFLLAKELKLAPAAIAQKLQAELTLPGDITRSVAVGPYLNFFLDQSQAVKTTISEILKSGPAVGSQPDKGETIVIDYSSPNIAKPFHVGHLRTTLIGLSLYRVYKHLGYNVVSVNHLGDWGTQFGLVWAGYLEAGEPSQFTLDDLVGYYLAANKKKKAQSDEQSEQDNDSGEDVTGVARDYFLRLEAGDEEALKFWQRCLDISVSYLKQFYDRLGINFDLYQGESFYRSMLPGVEENIRASGILENSRGALGVDLGKKLGFARIFTEDGRSLYITRDIACAYYRYDTYKPYKILYVVAAQQMLHFQHLKEITKRLNHPVADKIIHVAFGFVPGMKTREGGAIALKDFLDEAQQRALAVYTEQVDTRPEGLDEKQVAESVAIGAIYFYFLSHSNIKDFQFRWEEALNFQGDTGPYIQYTLARLYSIETKASAAGLSLAEDFDATLLKEESVRELVTKLAQFSEVLERVARDYEPNYLAELLLDISRCFNRAYRELRVVGQETALAEARLALFRSVRYVLETGMTLLGVPPVQRM